MKMSTSIGLALIVAAFGSGAMAQRRGPTTGGGAGEPGWTPGPAAGAPAPAAAVNNQSRPLATLCRATVVGGAVVPGGVVGDKCAVVQGNAVLQTQPYEVLLGDRSLQWVAFAGSVTVEAIPGGRDATGELFVCRVRAGGGAYLGHVSEARRCLYSGEGATAQSATAFDILIQAGRTGAQGDGRVFEKRGDRGGCDLSKASLNFTELWPADGRMFASPIFIKGVPNPVITKVEQDECVYGIANPDDAPDAAIGPGGRSVSLRRQRIEATAGGNGRIYTIHFSAPGCGDSTLTACVPTAAGVPCQDSMVRYDSSSAATSGLPACDPKCSDAEASVAKLLPGQGEWVRVSLTRITGYTITGVTQDECRDGEASARVTASSVELRNRFNPGGDGRVYTIHFRCAGGELGTVKVEVPKTGTTTAVDSGLTLDSTQVVVDPECCTPGLSQTQLTYIPGRSDLVTVQLVTKASSTVTGITQDECVTDAFDGKNTTTAIQLRNERDETGDGRVYTIRYQCGGANHLVTCAVPKTTTTTAVDSGQKYDSTKTSTDTECDACLRAEVSSPVLTDITHQLTTISIVNVDTYSITSVEQDECVGGGPGDAMPDGEIAGDARTVKVRAESDAGGNGRVYLIGFQCNGKSYTKTVQVPVSGQATATDSGKRYDSRSTTYPAECDRTPPDAVACGHRRVDSATAYVPDYCLYPISQGMEQLAISYSGHDDTTPAALLSYAIVAFTQDEPTTSVDTGMGTPDPLPDASIVSPTVNAFRGQRATAGDGRVYRVKVSATDQRGNVGYGYCNVRVPLAFSATSCESVIDSGQNYDSTTGN